MRNLVFFTVLSFCVDWYANAQYVSYETQSKWFMGFNVGGTWSTTDVKYKTYGGWGMTLGRSFNYDYGRFLSFDLRGRYLGGTWYGQSYDSTDLNAYQGTALMPYKTDSTMGFSVNNFQSTVREMSLEFVLHINRLYERTKWDPYIFAGIGATWHQTYGDLRVNDTIGDIYNYDLTQLSKSYINSITDQIYETPLDGTAKNQFRVNIMPSLGFGVGYRVGPRVTIGLEHKSTFTQIDDFDGFKRESNYKQDIYHYTSGFIQVRFKKRDQRTPRTDSPNSSTTSSTPSNQTNDQGCVAPVITLIKPSSSGASSGNISYSVIASIANVENRQNIVFKVNGISNLNFNFNPQTGRFESNVVLNPGANDIELTGTNICNSATARTTVTYRREEEKIKICHYPEVNTRTPQTIEIPSSAWPSHQAHGDQLGACPQSKPNSRSSGEILIRGGKIDIPSSGSNIENTNGAPGNGSGDSASPNIRIKNNGKADVFDKGDTPQDNDKKPTERKTQKNNGSEFEQKQDNNLDPKSGSGIEKSGGGI